MNVLILSGSNHGFAASAPVIHDFLSALDDLSVALDDDKDVLASDGLRDFRCADPRLRLYARRAAGRRHRAASARADARARRRGCSILSPVAKGWSASTALRGVLAAKPSTCSAVTPTGTRRDRPSPSPLSTAITPSRTAYPTLTWKTRFTCPRGTRPSASWPQPSGAASSIP